ncbi:MAG: hypothetical protein A2289_25050 [Deltaproteobacteria bacterium RIFOXYA12_FULL_58_15]|nr:MAG: hypothetical protein A2289_25050 [Deltaproteobacteria bacterium RIFOXYA12_FULL_58_15]OGR11007.1 MAG: hypothetical protein A2341_11510 [Deltaproteobacteria bacterium RIFOXYB12_FULL_58_9]
MPRKKTEPATGGQSEGNVNKTAKTTKTATKSKAKAATKSSPNVEPVAATTKAKTTTANTKRTAGKNGKHTLSTASETDRHKMIAKVAYRLAELRGFAGGDPQQDWFEAERQVDSRMSASN